MVTHASRTPEAEIFYPDTDPQQAVDNTANYDRMRLTLSAFRWAYECLGQPAFVAADLFVYPVKGDPDTNNAPDLLVAPTCPPGDRWSFKCWVEPGPITFAGEFLAVSKREKFDHEAVQDRIAFYRRYLGTRELFVYEPQGLGMHDGFRFFFLRLGRGGAYRPVRPGTGGWYASREIPFEIRPADTHVEVRDARTHRAYLPAELRASRERQRASQAERRLKELQRELGRLRRGRKRS